MEQIKMSVYVRKAASVAAGRSSYGSTEVTLSDADVAALSERAKRELLRTSRLEVDSADVPTVLAALEEAAVESEAREAEERARRERDVERLLAKPDEEWINRHYFSEEPSLQVPGSPELYGDPRVSKRLAALKPRLERERAEWRRQRDERAAAEKAAEDAKAAAASAYVEAIRALASREDDLARAAAEGYDCERAVLDRLASRLAEAVGAPHHAIDTRAWNEPEERPAPRPEAFALLDRVTAAAREANETIPSAIGQWAVSRIVRIDACPHEGRDEHGEPLRHPVTAVLATLYTPTGVREITCSTESLADTWRARAANGCAD